MPKTIKEWLIFISELMFVFGLFYGLYYMMAFMCIINHTVEACSK